MKKIKNKTGDNEPVLLSHPEVKQIKEDIIVL